VPLRPVGHDVVVAEGTFFDSADLAHGFLRLQVFVMGLEGDASQFQVFEGVVQLEELGLGVEAGTVKLRGEPSVAQLGGLVSKIQLGEAGATDHTVLLSQDSDPRHGFSRRL
jgi:hypothetical protein